MNRSQGQALIALLVLMPGIVAMAQTPQPFPRAAQSSRPPAPPPPATQPAAPQPSAGDTATSTDAGVPTEAQLGMPIQPHAQFITSYDAGRGQRYYLFGSAAPFAEVVAYYKGVLREKGTVVFEQPATHTFEVGKFREESMGFPPGITIKDYTTDGSAGYPNPKRGTPPERFPTIIQIVPPPAAPQAPAQRR